jgi:hypothetical protein
MSEKEIDEADATLMNSLTELKPYIEKAAAELIL